jgi:hypothetical protein
MDSNYSNQPAPEAQAHIFVVLQASKQNSTSFEK